MWFIFNEREKAQNALDQINANMGFPDGKGTETWAEIQQAHEKDLWFFVAPDEKYLQNVNFDELRADITDLLPKTDLTNANPNGNRARNLASQEQ